MSTVLKVLAALVGAVVLALVAFLAFVFATEHSPGAVEPVSVDGPVDAPPVLQAGVPFKVLSWNLQYGASRKYRFFYDGGDAVHVPAADVAETVAAIGAVLKTQAPAVALLQEIDRDSSRTGRIDQLPQYAADLGATHVSAAPYHKAVFVPKPASSPLGRVHMALGVLTRGPHRSAQRHQLALMDEPRVVQALNLKRALLTAEVPVAGLDQPLAVAVTHLSAFSFGDGTLEAQVAALADWMESRPPGQPWVLAGDFNLLPPGDNRDRLAVERDLYADETNPIESLIPRFTTAFPDPLDPAARTYLPFGADSPDRKIDYVFVGGPVRVQSAEVLVRHSDISDHLPIVLDVVVGETAAEPTDASAQ